MDNTATVEVRREDLFKFLDAYQIKYEKANVEIAPVQDVKKVADKKPKEEIRTYRSALGFQPFGIEEVSFLEFLKRVKNVEVGQLDIHFRPQWHLLGLNKGIKYDFIGHIENYDQDLNHVLNRINNQKSVDEILERRPHATRAAEKLKKYYGSEEHALVAEIYRDDFKYLGYGYSLDVL